MPRARKAGPRRRHDPTAELGRLEWHYLKHGSSWAPELGGFTRDEARQMWEVYRDEIMADWIAENPGTRPRAWWWWDAPEMREQTKGDPPSYPEWTTLNYYGKPSVLIPGVEYETQLAYLIRLNLLTDSEQQLLESGGLTDAETA